VCPYSRATRGNIGLGRKQDVGRRVDEGAGVLPWNFPFFLIARKLGPALVCGNSIVIKPSEETPNNAALFVNLLTGLDIPDGVINFVHGSGRATGDALCSHPDVGLISFTGSVATGSAIMKAAAKNITKVNLELGGKAPAIVCKDADIAQAAKFVAASRTHNNGQVCNAAERVYVERPIADKFVSALADTVKATRFGDPLGEKEIDMGPPINKAGLQKIEDLVDVEISTTFNRKRRPENFLSHDLHILPAVDQHGRLVMVPRA
jgi:lactaldehyde dehydrogenase/glycolaldehyde dehydrogenase